MATFFSFIRQHKLPPRTTLIKLLSRPLSWYGVILYALIAGILTTIYILIIVINSHFLVTIPARGGTLTEGVIGAPHVINPVLATTETDIGLTKLIYSGLVKEEVDGTLSPELAASYTVSPDQLIYTFVLRDDLKWSDNKPLTSDDVAFTISKLASPILHPSSYWQDVNIATPDPQTIIMTLPQARIDFLRQASVGIIPKHIWGDVPDEVFDSAIQNLQPVGSGPYTYVHMSTQNGVPRELSLKRNRHYALKRASLEHYNVVFFANQDDLLASLDAGTIDMTLAANPATAASIHNSNFVVDKIASPTIAGLFHLQNDPYLGNKHFLELFDHAIDKDAILATVEYGYGILPGTPTQTDRVSREDTFAALQSIGYTFSDGVLAKNGTPIGFSIGVENDPSLLIAARALAHEFETFGVVVTIKAFDRGTFQDKVAANEYQLFFADIRSTDIPRGYEPAINLYTKAFPFIHTNAIHITMSPYLDTPNDRYIHSEDWYIRVNRVWKIFSGSQTQTSIITTNN